MGKPWENDGKMVMFHETWGILTMGFFVLIQDFLVHITPITMVFVGDLSIVNGGYKPSCGEVGCENATAHGKWTKQY